MRAYVFYKGNHFLVLFLSLFLFHGKTRNLTSAPMDNVNTRLVNPWLWLSNQAGCVSRDPRPGMQCQAFNWEKSSPGFSGCQSRRVLWGYIYIYDIPCLCVLCGLFQCVVVL